jgi:hypothetical protein
MNLQRMRIDYKNHLILYYKHAKTLPIWGKVLIYDQHRSLLKLVSSITSAKQYIDKEIKKNET